MNDIDQALTSIIATENKTLHDAATYSLLAPGKRLRPKVAIQITEALGGSKEAALIPACALELIHCYSLIHDDLPCMDDDDFRRGKPSLHRAFPEAIAVLTGDYLLTKAFEIIAEAPLISDAQKIKLIQCLSKRSGAPGMIGGQVLDIEATGKNITPEHLDQIHHQKSADLLTAAALFGGIIADTDDETLHSLEQFGAAFGLAFQITDDLLDVTYLLHSLRRKRNTPKSDRKAPGCSWSPSHPRSSRSYFKLNKNLVTIAF